LLAPWRWQNRRSADDCIETWEIATAEKEQNMWLGLNASLQHGLPVPRATGDSSLGHASVGHLSEVGVMAVQVGHLEPWGKSYESILLAMELDGRFYVEGDGSFVVCGHQLAGAENQEILWLGDDASLVKISPTPGWRAAPATVVWRIEGNLFAGAVELEYATVNGFAPWSEWERLWQLIAPQLVVGPADGLGGVVSTDMVVQLHRYGQYVRLPEPPRGVA